MDKDDHQKITGQITRVQDRSVASRLDAKDKARERTAERLRNAATNMMRRPGAR